MIKSEIVNVFNILSNFPTIFELKSELEELITKDSYSDKDIKQIIDKIKVQSYQIFNDCNNISKEIQNNIIKNCDHEYILDISSYDPCINYYICTKCDNMR